MTMGCAKNNSDSEHLKAQLEFYGHKVTSDFQDNNTECAVINTCGFIQDAVKENIDAILDLEELKTQGRIKILIVAGCLVNRYEKELKQELPSVDLFVRSEEWEKITKFLGGTAKSEKSEKNGCPSISPINQNYWTRYLKISEGCNTLCSYCAIPMIRGRLRSVPIDRIITEANIMCSAGAKELCLVGQDLTVYGHDFNNGTDLKTLVKELNNSVPKGTWLRLLYLHPNRVNEALIDFLMTQDKVLHYLDIPIQHCDPEILSRMNRPCPEGHMKRIFNYIRDNDPLFTLRTTIMTGFPGENDSAFGRLMDFVSDIEFDRLGVFVYSPEDGTEAAKLKGRVSRKIAEARCNKLTELQAEISQERGELFIGRELDVLLEETDESGAVWGRSYRDAPEVDGMICVEGTDFKAGNIIRAEIYDCEINDLYGERRI